MPHDRSFTSPSNFRKIPLLLLATCLRNCVALMRLSGIAEQSRALALLEGRSGWGLQGVVFYSMS